MYAAQQQYYSGRWGAWGNWKCTEECISGVQAARKRKCKNNYSGTTCAPDANGLTSTETKPCQGLCKKSKYMY